MARGWRGSWCGRWARCIAAAVLLLAAGSAAAAKAGATPFAERVVVSSGWNGLFPLAPERTTVVITRTGRGYRMDGLTYDRAKARAYSRAVDASAVARLVKALQAPRRPVFTFDDLGDAGSKELARVQAAVRDDMAGDGFTSGQKALLKSALDDPRKIEDAISRSRPATHTDDFPHMSVEATLDDFTRIKAETASQHPFMLPWVVGGGKTFDPAIAEALRDLLPAEATNVGRLTLADDSIGSLAEMFYSGMDDALSDARAKDEAGEAAAALRATFQARDLRMAGSMRPDAPDRATDLIATLRLPDAPPNLEMRFRVTVIDGKANGLDEETERARVLFRRVAASPVLKAQLAVNSTAVLTIDYWCGTSLHGYDAGEFGDEAGEFARYMQKVVGMPVTPRQLADAALVHETGEASRDWVVLPDGTTVLWRTTSREDPALLAKSCGLSGEEGDAPMLPIFRCIGRVFAPDGSVLH